MSACQCNYGGSSFLGCCVMRNRTARTIPKRGNICSGGWVSSSYSAELTAADHVKYCHRDEEEQDDDQD